jgi:hypothetical protein
MASKLYIDEVIASNTSTGIAFSGNAVFNEIVSSSANLENLDVSSSAILENVNISNLGVSGDVKIGAGIPAEKLDIDGNIKISEYIDHGDLNLGQVGNNTRFHRYAQYYTNVNIGWYTVAINPGNRAGGLFEVYDGRSSRHSHRSFYAGHMYGSQSGIFVYGNVAYSSGGAIRYARIKEGGTYDGALLQIYVDDDSSAVGIRVYDHMAGSGWYLVNWVPDGTDPGGLGNFSALVNAYGQVDFNTAGFVYRIN